MKRFILAHDLGTTGNKATLFDDEGRLVASTFSGYETAHPQATWAEQNPDDWWRAVTNASRELLSKSRLAPQEIAVIAFSGQMMGCLPVDAAGNPLHMVVFSREDPETNIITAYFSPSAHTLAALFNATPCEKPSPDGLTFLVAKPRGR